MDVAVFRFTLGIPGFEDRLIPRVVGVIGLVLLGVNHILGAQPPPDAQVCQCASSSFGRMPGTVFHQRSSQSEACSYR